MTDVLAFQMNPEGDRRDIYHIIRESGISLTTLDVINIWDPIPTELPEPDKIVLTGSALTLGEDMPAVYRERSDIVLSDILSRIERGTPILGICYSSQLVANALWPGSVQPTGKWNIGRTRIIPVQDHPIFENDRSPMSITVSYKEALRGIPPENVLAIDSEGNILAYQYKSFIGLLGHPEIPTWIVDMIIQQRADDPRYPNVNVVQLTPTEEDTLPRSITIIQNFLKSE
jgi:GMP synthase-like glutamine amidotransferase